MNTFPHFLRIKILITNFRKKGDFAFMKKKSRHAQLKRAHEFRYHNVDARNKFGKRINIKHPAYVFLKKGNIFIYVTITHSSKVEDYVVIKLRKNPNPLDKKDAYYVAIVKEDIVDNFKKRERDWRMDPLDDADIRKLIK